MREVNPLRQNIYVHQHVQLSIPEFLNDDFIFLIGAAGTSHAVPEAGHDIFRTDSSFLEQFVECDGHVHIDCEHNRFLKCAFVLYIGIYNQSISFAMGGDKTSRLHAWRTWRTNVKPFFVDNPLQNPIGVLRMEQVSHLNVGIDCKMEIGFGKDTLVNQCSQINFVKNIVREQLA